MRNRNWASLALCWLLAALPGHARPRIGWLAALTFALTTCARRSRAGRSSRAWPGVNVFGHSETPKTRSAIAVRISAEPPVPLNLEERETTGPPVPERTAPRSVKFD